MNNNFSPLRLLLGADAWRPEDLPEFRDDGGTQEFRARRIEELEQELAELNHELTAQANVDSVVENVLRASFPEACAHE